MSTYVQPLSGNEGNSGVIEIGLDQDIFSLYHPATI